MNLYDLYESTIKPAIFERLDSVFPEFGWKRFGRGWVATNSEYTKRMHGVRADRVVCNLTHGQVPPGYLLHGTDTHHLWTELQNGGCRPTGQEFCEIVSALAAKVGIDAEFSEAFSEQARIRKERRDKAAARAVAAHDGVSSSVAAYWSKRSLGLPLPDDMGSESGHLFALVRDYRGDIAGTFIRRLDGSEPKYQYSEGLDWDELCATNLGAAVKSKEMTVVEGILEPFLLSPHGIEVQAVGGSLDKLTVERWRRIIKLGIKTVYLMGDNDVAGQKGLHAALAAFRSMDQGDLVDVRVVSTADYQACKDAGEMLVELGATSIHTARAKAEHHFHWLAQDLVGRHRGSSWTSASLARCIHESMEILAQVPGTQWPYAVSLFQGYLEREVPDYGRCRLQIEQRILQEKEHERRAQDFNRTLESAKQLLTNPGDVTDFELSTLAGRISELAAEPIDAPDSIQLLARHEQRVERYRGLQEKIIGLAQRTLPLVDELTCGLRGLIVLVAPPNVGKTALVWQWGLDIIQDNPQSGFVCFSMEMSAEAMVTRAVCNIAGVGWRDYMFGTLTPAQERRIATARSRWRTNAHRILILDRHAVLDKAAAELSTLVSDWAESAEVGRVYQAIDYIQAWPIPESVQRDATRGGGAATVESWLMELCLGLVRNDGDDPVVAISTQRKAGTDAAGNWANGLDTAMGAAIVTYAPDVVAFANPARDDELRDFLNKECGQMIEPLKGDAGKKEMAKWREELQKDGRSFLNLVIAKGRDGTERGAVPLTFYYRENRFQQGWEWDVFKGHKDGADTNLPPGLEDCGEVFGRPRAVETVYTVGSGEVLDDGEPV